MNTLKTAAGITRLLESIVAIGSIGYGLGIAIVAFIQNETIKLPVADVLVSPAVTISFVLFNVFAGILILVGHKRKVNYLLADGLFLVAIVRIFQLIAVWLKQGFLQPSWITPGMLLAVIITLWIGRQVYPDALNNNGP